MRLEVVVGGKGMRLEREVGLSGARAVRATIGERCCGWAREWMKKEGRERGVSAEEREEVCGKVDGRRAMARGMGGKRSGGTHWQEWLVRRLRCWTRGTG